MKTGNLKEYLKDRFTEKEFEEIYARAEKRVAMFKAVQESLADSVKAYMEKHDVGFNELADKLHWTPRKVSQVKQGRSNLTLVSLVDLCIALEKKPQDILNIKALNIKAKK